MRLSSPHFSTAVRRVLHNTCNTIPQKFIAYLTFDTCLLTVFTLRFVLFPTILSSETSSGEETRELHAVVIPQTVITSSLAATEIGEREGPHLSLNGSS